VLISVSKMPDGNPVANDAHRSIDKTPQLHVSERLIESTRYYTSSTLTMCLSSRPVLWHLREEVRETSVRAGIDLLAVEACKHSS